MSAYQPDPDTRKVTITAMDLLILAAIAVEALKTFERGEARDNLKACIDRVLEAEKETRTK